MSSMKRSLTIAITWFITCCFLSLPLPTLAQKSILSAGQCNQKKMAQYEADFDKLIAIQEAEGNSVSRQTKKDMEIVASAYIDMSAKCFDQLYAKNSSALGIKSFQIDNGGIAMLPDSKSLLVSEFTLRGTKWGANSPFVRGENQLGPRTRMHLNKFFFRLPTIIYALVHCPPIRLVLKRRSFAHLLCGQPLPTYNFKELATTESPLTAMVPVEIFASEHILSMAPWVY